MNYTPPDQKLEEPLRALIEKIAPVREVMIERPRNTRDWSAEHQEELREWVKRLAALEVDAMKLKDEVR